MSKEVKKQSNFDCDFAIAMQKAFDATMPAHEKKKLYVAGPWFDEKAEALMINVKEAFRQYESVSAWEPYYPNEHTQDSPMDTFIDNVNQIRSCDAVLALISRKDIGTAFEIGFARGLCRPIYILVLDDTDFYSKTNIMLAYSTDKILQFKDLWKFIIGKLRYTDLITLNDSWEDKE